MDVLVVVDEEQARHRAPETGIHERDPADEPHVVAKRAHAARFVARSLERGAEGRLDETRHQPDGSHADDEREVIERHRIVEIHTERRRAGEPAQPVVPVGNRYPAVRRAPKHLRERERKHEKAESRGAQRDQAEGAGHERGAGERDRGDQPVADTELEMHERGEIGRDAEIRRVAECRQATVAEQHIDAGGEHGEDDHLACQVDVVLAGDERQKRQSHHQGEPLHAANFPKSPFGRKAMTRIIGRKRITYARSGSSATPKV